MQQNGNPATRPAQDFASAAAGLDRPSYENLRRALELGRWPDGRRLDDRQRQICMETVAIWEARHLPPEQRTGHLEKRACSSRDPVPDRVRLLDADQ